MSKILIKNGKVWDGEKFFFADVLTDGKVISKIEKNISYPAEFVFDAEGKIVSAGLVDLHVHMKGIASEKFGICKTGDGSMSCNKTNGVIPAVQ